MVGGRAKGDRARCRGIDDLSVRVELFASPVTPAPGEPKRDACLAGWYGREVSQGLPAGIDEAA